MKKQFEEALMRECEVLELLLESSDDEEQSKSIIKMLSEIAKYLNNTVED